MGHTLVTRFDAGSMEKLHQILQPFSPNKIPFGRDCDRKKANEILPYHMTVFHWAKTWDGHYLECLKDFKSVPCRIEVTGAHVMQAEEGSLLLYFAVRPAEGYRELAESVERAVHGNTSRFLHITLAASKEQTEIRAMEKHIRSTVAFPFVLQVEGLDLYHIWKPVTYVRTL